MIKRLVSYLFTALILVSCGSPATNINQQTQFETQVAQRDLKQQMTENFGNLQTTWDLSIPDEVSIQAYFSQASSMKNDERRQYLDNYFINHQGDSQLAAIIMQKTVQESAERLLEKLQIDVPLIFTDNYFYFVRCSDGITTSNVFSDQSEYEALGQQGLDEFMAENAVSCTSDYWAGAHSGNNYNVITTKDYEYIFTFFERISHEYVHTLLYNDNKVFGEESLNETSAQVLQKAIAFEAMIQLGYQVNVNTDPAQFNVSSPGNYNQPDLVGMAVCTSRGGKTIQEEPNVTVIDWPKTFFQYVETITTLEDAKEKAKEVCHID